MDQNIGSTSNKMDPLRYISEVLYEPERPILTNSKMGGLK
jgi:hypothetical protein